MYRARSLCATVAFGETELLCGAALVELCACVWGGGYDNGWDAFGLSLYAWVVHGPWNLCLQIDAHKNWIC